MAYIKPEERDQFEQFQLPDLSPPTPIGVLVSPGGDIVASGEADRPLIVENRGIAIGKNGYIRGQQRDYNTGTGFFLGFSGGKYKLSIGDGGSNSLTWDGTTLTVTGSLTVSKLDIPDTTTANSFHTDTSGNSWWGANVASGYANANAYVLSTGAALFKNVQVGGTSTQYTVQNNGMATFGDGSDGAATFDGAGAVTGWTRSGSTYTADRDTYFTDATISTGVTLDPNGYRMFGTGTLTFNGTGKLSGNGNAGGAGSSSGNSNGAAGGSIAAALADGYLKGSLAGKGGSTGGNGGSSANGVASSAGSAGTGTSNSIGSNGVAGTTGGAGGDAPGFTGGAGAAGQAGGTATASNVKLIANWHLMTLLDIGSTGTPVKFDNAGSPGSSGGGGGGAGAAGGTGGGGGGGGSSGSSGRIVAIYFRSITVGASASITANGGAGGNGGNGAAGQAGNGGGGGGGAGGTGGNGGQIILVYNTLTNNGSITASGGAAGAAGSGGAGLGTGVAGSNGAAGTAGTAGTVRQFQVSL